MSIKSKKIENNRDPNKRCGKCGKKIEIGASFYFEKNKTQNTPLMDKWGSCICEDCHNE